MGRFTDAIRCFLGKERPPCEEDAEALRRDFRERYHHFKLLLNANNRALEIMAELEEALKGTRPFGMAFVRSRLTAASASVWQIVRHLNLLAPERPEYEVLFDRFREIQKEINPYVRGHHLPADGPLVLPLDRVDREAADVAGGKMANLGELANRLHLDTPPGFVVTVHGFQRFLSHNDLQAEIDRRIQSAEKETREGLHALSADLQQLIIRSPLPGDLEEALAGAYEGLEAAAGAGVTVAMRSSALGEDAAGTSFAGQYRSELNVSRDNLSQAYREVVASKYSLPAMSYRLSRGLRDEDIAMCVGVLAMVEASVGGVTYSSNPVDVHDDRVTINATWGLPKSVVDGSEASDLFVLERGDPPRIVRREIQEKVYKVLAHPSEGLRREAVPEEEAQGPALTDEQAVELARLALRVEEHYGTPQDVEWAIRPDGTVLLLQCRALQQAEETAEGVRGEVQAEDPTVLLSGGNAASPGAAAGPVCVVRKEAELLRFPRDGVLVASQALPRWASVLDRAAAVVAEQGSVAGHLANVAREFGVPALFGVKGALDRLEDGAPVTVDADARRVHQGRVERLLERRQRPRNLMKGSPVYEALEGAARLVTPLHLLDPDAPSFRAAHCRTFHDITRFCHEKSVTEMFRFGRDHHFPERSSKQLVCDVPMQWWVLNLDDGFAEEVEGRYVQIENIVSIPMRAVWEGISAKPWAGPPPVDSRGFASVMFQATTNPALVPGLRTRYANRNYFMISRNYCSLSSRMGFHFSILESLVSERASENYISFQFKGGAADLQRKQKRVAFIRGILEAHDFRVDVKEDTLLARIEDRGMDYMKNRLNILGYLIIHTRQLDMIMANEETVQYYRNEMEQDIRELFPPFRPLSTAGR
jgi:pyruvate, water dikinase